MYSDESELGSCTESRLNSSFSKSHIYEKLVRKQMTHGDPELASILNEADHSYGRTSTPTRGDGSLSSSSDPFRDSQGSYGRRTPTNYNERSQRDSQNSHERRTPTHGDHGAPLDHYHDLDFQPIGNRSLSVDHLDRRGYERNNDRVSGQSERSYDYPSGRRSAELRNHREITHSTPNVNNSTRHQRYYSDEEQLSSSDHRNHSGLPPTPPSRRAPSSGDRRCVTPDPLNHNNSSEQTSSSPAGHPVLKSALVTSRTTPVPSITSRPSSRSSIPIVASSSSKDDTTKIQDLEDTIVTLKKLLSDRDKETNLIRKENQDLHATNCQLKTQLEEFRKEGRKTPTNSTSDTEDSKPVIKTDLNLSTKNEYERKINQLINERENLETEMWKLRQQLGERADGAGSAEENGLDNYKPNNPYALQRKIDELQSQIQDMQEASETTASNSSRSELEIQKLKIENGKLKEELVNVRQELEAENRRLQEEVEKLRSLPAEGVVNGSLDELTLQSEVQALRQDLRFLREKNHQLNEDNIKLIEHLQDLRRREKEQLHSSPQSHIPRGISDVGHVPDDKFSSDFRSSSELRKFSPIPSIRNDKDSHHLYSPPSSKYSTGNLRPSSRKYADPDSAPYKYERFNGHKEHESSDCTATLATAPPNGYVADEGTSDFPVANGDIVHDPPSFFNVSRGAVIGLFIL